MKFEMSHFKKVKEDKHTATLKHPDGHEIRVAKKNLKPEMIAQLKKLPMFAEGGESTPTSLPSPDEQMWDKEAQGATAPLPFAAPPTSAPLRANGPRLLPTGPNLGPSPQQPGGPANPMARMPDPFEEQIQGLRQGFNQERQGIQGAAVAAGNLGNEEAKAAAHQQSMQLEIQKNHQMEFEKLNDEIKGAIKDVNEGHIDPDHYMNSKSDAGRVASAIGLILGGIGGGLTHQKNPALEFLNNQINRDVEAQRLNLGKKETVLNAYYKQMGNLNDATKMTYAFYNELYANEITKQAALAKSPQAQAAAMQAAGQLQQKSAATIGPLSYQRAMFNMMQNQGGNQDAAGMMIRFGAPPNQQEMLFKELQGAQNHAKQSDVIMKAFDLANQQNTIGGRVSHAGYEPASVAQMQTLMMPYLKDAEGRINEQELERTDALIPRPGDGAAKIEQKRTALHQFLEEKGARPMLGAYNIRTPQAPGARGNPNAGPGYKK